MITRDLRSWDQISLKNNKGENDEKGNDNYLCINGFDQCLFG